MPTAAAGSISQEQVCAGPSEPHEVAVMGVTDTIEIPPNQASRGDTTHPLQPRSPGLHAHPWKLPGTVILRFTSAFMTRLTIS